MYFMGRIRLGLDWLLRLAGPAIALTLAFTSGEQAKVVTALWLATGLSAVLAFVIVIPRLERLACWRYVRGDDALRHVAIYAPSDLPSKVPLHLKGAAAEIAVYLAIRGREARIALVTKGSNHEPAR
ncbi:MAG TPA: hypothetical protein VF713_12540 [Thermoanaerobaculia bacterium]